MNKVNFIFYLPIILIFRTCAGMEIEQAKSSFVRLKQVDSLVVNTKVRNENLKKELEEQSSGSSSSSGESSPKAKKEKNSAIDSSAVLSKLFLLEDESPSSSKPKRQIMSRFN